MIDAAIMVVVLVLSKLESESACQLNRRDTKSKRVGGLWRRVLQVEVCGSGRGSNADAARAGPPFGRRSKSSAIYTAVTILRSDK